MKIIHYTQVPPITMNNEQVKNVAGRVLIGNQDGAANFCMRRFEIGHQGFTPKHSHDWEHEVWVLEGKGEVFIENIWQTLKPGTAVFIPPNAEHQFRNNSGAPFAFLCLVPSQAPEI